MSANTQDWKEAALQAGKKVSELQQRIAELEQREQELAATVERLRDAGQELYEELEAWLQSGSQCEHWSRLWDKAKQATPQQNLNALKREDILNIHFPNRYPRRMWTGTEVQNWLIEYANTKYPSDKE